MVVDVCGPEDRPRQRFAVTGAGRVLAVFWGRDAAALDEATVG